MASCCEIRRFMEMTLRSKVFTNLKKKTRRMSHESAPGINQNKLNKMIHDASDCLIITRSLDHFSTSTKTGT